MSARLWVTGLGLVTPLGLGVEATWSRLVRGDRGIRPVTLFDASSQRVGLAGEVDGIEVPADGWSRTSLMAARAAEEAMRAAHVDVAKQRVGLVVAGTTGGMFETELLLARLHVEPGSREVLRGMRAHPLTATGDRLDERLGPFARIRTISSACSGGANALVVAAGWSLAGEVDVVVAGGSDGLCRLTLSGFNALGALDPEPCRPFDRRRRGTSLGEGAGFVVLERAESARERRATPVAELAGWAQGSEAHHITNPTPDGALVASLIARALARAGLTPRDVDYVNAHGTGTPLNEPMEATALATALGPELSRIPVSSSKAQLGHSLAAAGAVEAVITALVVSRRTLVPTAGLDEPDPALGLTHVPLVGRPVPRVRVALSNAFGFGGMDTVLAFAEAERESPPSREPVVGAMVVTGAAVFGACGLVGTEACGALVDRSGPGDAEVDPDVHLDAARARRLDRAARLGAVAVERALSDAGSTSVATGLVLGSAFGSLDATAAFMHRILERGPRAAGPAEFPNLVPSSPVGHVSIYLGLRGPAFATADLATSGECAFVQAVQLVAAGEAPRVVAGTAEPRSELAAAVVVEREAEARRRGARILVRVRQVLEWRGEGPSTELAPPRAGSAEVVLPRTNEDTERALAATPWRDVSRLACAGVLGEGDGLGAAAIAVAVGRVVSGRTDQALVLGLGEGHGYAVILDRG